MIFTGLFRYKEELVDNDEVYRHYVHWRERINNGDYKTTLNHLNSNYYDSYVNNIFPEINFEKEVVAALSNERLNHLTLKEAIHSDKFKNVRLKIREGYEVVFHISFIDMYHFPQQIGMFTFRADFAEKDKVSFSLVSDFINKMRSLSAELILNNGEKLTVRQLAEKYILRGLRVEDQHWDTYNPQLKSYCQADIPTDIPDEELDNLLYDLGNVAPLGSASGKGGLAPSDQYFEHLMENHSISVFKNWKALALNDTFTRISINFPDNFHTWTNDYFNIYIYCLYLKFNLFLINSELSDITIIHKKTQAVRDRFLEFINDYNLSHISYRFLPNLLMHKVSGALDIQSELDKMELKVSRLNTVMQEKRDKTLNRVLITITIINVFGVIYDLAEWGIKLGYPADAMYPYTSIGIAILTFLIIFILFTRKRK